MYTEGLFLKTKTVSDAGFDYLKSTRGRAYDGNNYGIRYFGAWWSSSEYETINVWYRTLGYDYDYLNGYYYVKENGYSVRCLKD